MLMRITTFFFRTRYTLSQSSTTCHNMNKKLQVTVCLALLFLGHVENSKILGVFPVCLYSHYIVGFRLMVQLAGRGHQVTMVSCYPQKPPIANFTNIYLDDQFKSFTELKEDIVKLGSEGPMAFVTYAHKMASFITDKTLSSTKLQALLTSEETFDLVMIDECIITGLLGLAAHFKAPSVLVNTLRTSIWSNYYFGNPEEPAYIPHIYTDFISQMNFYERLVNGFLMLNEYITRHLSFLPTQDEILHKYLPHVPHLNDIIYNQSLMLVNSHISFEYPVPQLPNIIEVGGFHVPPPKALPKNLQEFLDGAKDGAVYFSLGSHMLSKNLGAEKIIAITRTISKSKHKFIWKFENDSLSNKPANLLTGKWFPQSDILAHPNVRVFISHGGLLSSIEALYHGVPVVGIPFYADQKNNIRRACFRGHALALPYADLTEETFTAVLKEVIENPKYTENVKWRSKLLHDRPMSPMDTAIYWVEYVIRHRGALHFRSAALDLHWYQKYMLDVFALLLLILAILVYCLFLVARTLLSRKPKVESQKKKS